MHSLLFISHLVQLLNLKIILFHHFNLSFIVLLLFISKYFSSVHYPYSPYFFIIGTLPGICQTILLSSSGLFPSLLYLLLSLWAGVGFMVILSTVISILLLKLSLCFTICIHTHTHKYWHNKLLVYVLYMYSKCLHLLV